MTVRHSNQKSKRSPLMMTDCAAPRTCSRKPSSDRSTSGGVTPRCTSENTKQGARSTGTEYYEEAGSRKQEAGSRQQEQQHEMRTDVNPECFVHSCFLPPVSCFVEIEAMPDVPTHDSQFRVRYGETGRMGVVYHAE